MPNHFSSLPFLPQQQQPKMGGAFSHVQSFGECGVEDLLFDSLVLSTQVLQQSEGAAVRAECARRDSLLGLA